LHNVSGVAFVHFADFAFALLTFPAMRGMMDTTRERRSLAAEGENSETQKRQIHSDPLLDQTPANDEMVLHGGSDEQMGKRAVQKR
jgi:hypothetical protein